MSEEIYKQKFINRVQKHINRVNQFAQKLGLNYPNHDNDKLSSPLLDMYYLDKKSDYVDLTDKEEKLLLKAGMQHRLNSPHHPEYWDKGNIKNMTGIRGNPKKLFNVQNMPLEAVTEMCCDWCAMSNEFGNTPFEWYNHIKGRRYIFSKEQEDYILKTLKKLWYGKQNNQIEKITESWTDSYDLYDIYENYQPYNVLMEFEDGEQNIWFPLIKPTEYKQALLEFMKMGELVRFPKDKVFKWLEIIMKNTCIIDAMTALAGHTAWFPYDDCRNVYDELEDAETDYYIFSEFLDEQGFYDWCKLPDGSDAWSDFGLQPLWDILDEYQENMTAEQVLVLVNRCLDVTHQRGDLPSAFIEGGSSSLTKISNESVELKESLSFEPTDDYFAIGGKVFAEEDENCEVYNIYNDGIHIGMLAIEEYPETIVLEGLEIFKKYRRQGFGKKVVDLLKKKRKRIYVRAIPSAKKFWQKQGHNAYYNKDSGTYDGDLIYEELNESIAYVESNNDKLEYDDLYETPISDEDYDKLKIGDKVVYDDNDFKMVQPSKYDSIVDKDDDTITTQTRHHGGQARTNVKWNKDHFKRKFSLKESLSFELTDDEFVLGGKEFHEEGEDIQVFNIYNDTVKIGMLAIKEYTDNSISLDGLKILPKFRKQGFGKRVVDLLKKKYKGIYVRAIPSAKKFWKKQGHNAYYNNDSGTYDGDLIYDFDESKLNESIKVVHMDDDRTWFGYGNYPNKVGNDGIRIIYGMSDFKSYCQKHNARVIYDIENNYFIVADVYNYAHIHIEEIFQDNDIKISDNTYHFKTQVTTDNEESVSYDGYRYRYNFGSFIIYTRDRYIETLPILNDLGKYEFTDLKNNISESLNEELIHSENSYYGDHTSVILKNPTLRELKEYNLMQSRFICFGDIWVFFDASQWIHYQIIKRYPQYKSVDMGFYDFKKKTFYFIKSFDAEDDVSDEFYVEKKMKELKLHRWLLSQPYITQNFKNFKVEVFGDWVDSPWN